MSRPKLICSIPNCADPQCDREHVYTCCFCYKSVSEDEGVWTSFRRVAHAACLLERNKEEKGRATVIKRYIARVSRCPRGHELTGENLLLVGSHQIQRRCRTCYNTRLMKGWNKCGAGKQPKEKQ